MSSQDEASKMPPIETKVEFLQEEGSVEVTKASTSDTTSQSSKVDTEVQDIVSVLSKPFNFVSGNVSKKKNFFSPNKRKKHSGLLSVLSTQATRRRIVLKNGALNTATSSAEAGKSHRLFKDMFITILDLSWSWIFFIFSAAFFCSWLLFAVIWYLIALGHGDFNEENLADEDFQVCVDNVGDFTEAFLFSVETQHTIGYGGRATTRRCALAIITMCVQSIVGVIIQACMAGIIFAKFTVPRTRGQTIIFSKNAVISMRNGCLYLMCRVSDLRKTSLLEAHVRMVLIHKVETDEGEVIPYQETELEAGSELDGSNERVLIFWPTTIAHKINSDSPLYEMSPGDLTTSQFELLVTLEGVTEETGNTIQARTSYLPNEIFWGHRFDHNSVIYDKKEGVHSVHHGVINDISQDGTPKCSAKALELRS